MRLAWFLFFIIACCHQCHATEANCTVAGKFPNNLSNDCRTFTMCLKILNDFTRIDLMCPEQSIYSHIESQCTNVTSYRCLPEYNCTHVGDFPNPNVNDCGSYISCAEGLGSVVTARLADCPPGTLYNSDERSCVNNTMFDCVVTTPIPPKVFEVSVKFSTVPDRVNSTNRACCKRTEYITFIVFIVLSLFNKI